MSIETQQLKKILQAAMMSYGQPLTVDRMLALFDEDSGVTKSDIREVIGMLQEESADNGIELVEVASGFRYQARQENAAWVGRLWEEKPPRYSRALLETLVLIAYRQPITRGEIESIRGVSVSSHIIKSLLERDWVKVVGHRDVPGRPAIYATTKVFLDYFNLKSLEQLPTLSEIRDLDKISEEVGLDSEQAMPAGTDPAVPKTGSESAEGPGAEAESTGTTEIVENSTIHAANPENINDQEIAADVDNVAVAESTGTTEIVEDSTIHAAIPENINDQEIAADVDNVAMTENIENESGDLLKNALVEEAAVAATEKLPAVHGDDQLVETEDDENSVAPAGVYTNTSPANPDNSEEDYVDFSLTTDTTVEVDDDALEAVASTSNEMEEQSDFGIVAAGQTVTVNESDKSDVDDYIDFSMTNNSDIEAEDYDPEAEASNVDIELSESSTTDFEDMYLDAQDDSVLSQGKDLGATEQLDEERLQQSNPQKSEKNYQQAYDELEYDEAELDKQAAAD